MSEEKASLTPEDPASAITAVEVALRDLIAERLGSVFGKEWVEQCGVEPERIRLWERRQAQDAERREGARVTDRLIDYSDLSDLGTIITTNWSHFEECLGNEKTFDVYLQRLADLRNPEKHARGLLPFERALVTGMSGEIRNKVTIYRSAQGPARQFFPRIESAEDSFGNLVRGPDAAIDTELILHPGESVTFECRGWDPEGQEVDWHFSVSPSTHSLQYKAEADSFTWQVTDQEIADPQTIAIFLVSRREYHRHGWYDDRVLFRYRVLPSPRETG